MRIRKEEQVDLAKRILIHLKEQKLLTFRESEEKALQAIESVIAKNLQEEAAIEEEVKKIMERYRAQIASGAVDPQKIYRMIKKQIARERKFVL